MGKSGEREAGVSPQRSESEERLEAGRESLADEAVRVTGTLGASAVVQHVTVPSESEMRDEAMGAVAQRATVPRECESEMEQRLPVWASASWVITTRASFWVCRCRLLCGVGNETDFQKTILYCRFR